MRYNKLHLVDEVVVAKHRYTTCASDLVLTFTSRLGCVTVKVTIRVICFTASEQLPH